MILIGMVDPDDQKSTASYVFSLSLTSKKQRALFFSSSKVEYQAAINASQEALWL
jgi:hypothetical protein